MHCIVYVGKGSLRRVINVCICLNFLQTKINLTYLKM
jgi:hypothetical protein